MGLLDYQWCKGKPSRSQNKTWGLGRLLCHCVDIFPLCGPAQVKGMLDLPRPRHSTPYSL